MGTSFDIYKENALRDLKKALIKGEVDEPIIHYLEILNSKDNIYTTSSCYGRITVDSVPLIDNKRNHTWLGKWHRNVNANEILDALKKGIKNITYIKQEPFILHIGARDIETANTILSVARDRLGLKRSGIMHLKPRIMLEIMGLDYVSLPAKYNEEYLIDLKNIDKIVEILNAKFNRNEERLKRFINEVDKSL